MNDLYNQLNGRNDVAHYMQNPQDIGRLLFERGKITERQLNEIQGLSPAQIGAYLLRNGVMSNPQMQALARLIKR